MTQYDWQRFVDGSLGADELALHQAALESDPGARAELDGLRALRTATRESVRAAVAEAPARRAWPALLPWAVAAVAVLVAALALFPRQDPMRFDTSPMVAGKSDLEYGKTLEWLRAKSGIAVPNLDFGADGCFRGGMYGEGWACLYFSQGGIPYQLFVREDAPQLEKGRSTRLACGVDAYVGQGVGWRSGGLSYYLRSDKADDVRAVAASLADQTEKDVPKSG